MKTLHAYTAATGAGYPEYALARAKRACLQEYAP
jgi:hypothetical protein